MATSGARPAETDRKMDRGSTVSYGSRRFETPLTTERSGSPRIAASASVAAVVRSLWTAGTLAEAMCELTITFSIARIG